MNICTSGNNITEQRNSLQTECNMQEYLLKAKQESGPRVP